MVNLIFNLKEWGSVQIQTASTTFTLDKPGIFLKQADMSSLDSRSTFIHGGKRNLTKRWSEEKGDMSRKIKEEGK
jgi:hypothetical protein